jgi:hypothetical protein
VGGAGDRAGRVARISRRLMAVVGVVIFVLAIVDLTGLLSNGDAYGRLDIPGTKVFHFPKRLIEISFETQLQTTSGAGGLVVPALSLSVERADGRGPDPSVVQSFGSSTSVNGDAHRRVWKMTITQAGYYRVMASGEVGPYIDPQLTFGHSASFGPSFEIGLLALVGLLAVSLVAGRIAKRDGGHELAGDAGSSGTPGAPFGARDEPTSPTRGLGAVEVIGVLAAGFEQLGEDHLDRPGDRDRGQGAEDAGDLGADQDRGDDAQR